jgi:U-box domain
MQDESVVDEAFCILSIMILADDICLTAHFSSIFSDIRHKHAKMELKNAKGVCWDMGCLFHKNRRIYKKIYDLRYRMSRPNLALTSSFYLGVQTMRVLRESKIKDREGAYMRESLDDLMLAVSKIEQRNLHSTEPTLDEEHWDALRLRMKSVWYRLRSSDAAPVAPELYICPIGLVYMNDPVCTKYGESYERKNIEMMVESRGIDMHGRSLNKTELYENKILKDVIDNHRLHELRYSDCAL